MRRKFFTAIRSQFIFGIYKTDVQVNCNYHILHAGDNIAGSLIMFLIRCLPACLPFAGAFLPGNCAVGARTFPKWLGDPARRRALLVRWRANRRNDPSKDVENGRRSRFGLFWAIWTCRGVCERVRPVFTFIDVEKVNENMPEHHNLR